MIAKMSKYAFVLYAAQSDDFIGRLRELGLVDITTTGWEPSEEDRQLMLDIEGCTRAAEFLKTFRADAGRFDAQAAPFASGEEAYARYAAAQREAAALQAEIGRLEKAAEELRRGGFRPRRVSGRWPPTGWCCAISRRSATFSTRMRPDGPRSMPWPRSAGRMLPCGSSSWRLRARRFHSMRRR